jgi:triosephosphate isomerase
MRTPIIAGNWKMYKTMGEATVLLKGIKKDLGSFDKAEVVVCPVFTVLNTAYGLIENSMLKLGAQNLSWEKEGAFTGEISPLMIKDCGCEYVIIGHSERRQYFGETDETVNKKMKAALNVGLMPIVCVGETLAEREGNKTNAVIEKQLAGAFADISNDDMVQVVIAYEPIWAIGTGKTATPDMAQAVHKFIREWLTSNFNGDIAQATRILYGGSVKPENIKELMAQDDIDGGLVGGPSLKAESFVAIAKNAVA